MAIDLVCVCGQRYSVKDEFAGQQVRCPGCGQVLSIPDTRPPSSRPAGADAPPAQARGPSRRRAELDEPEPPRRGGAPPGVAVGLILLFAAAGLGAMVLLARP